MPAATLSAAPCFSSLQACYLRAARIDDAGLPIVGATNGHASKALVSIQSTPEVETGEEFTDKNGCGDLVVSYKEDDHIKRVTLTMELGQLDYEMLELLTGGSVITVGGETVGWQLPLSTDSPERVFMEAWSIAWDGNQQATDDLDAALWHHWVWPSVSWVPGAHTIQRGVLRVPLTGFGIENANIGNGPWNDLPAGLVGSAEAVFLDNATPDVACGYATVPAASA